MYAACTTMYTQWVFVHMLIYIHVHVRVHASHMSCLVYEGLWGSSKLIHSWRTHVYNVHMYTHTHVHVHVYTHVHVCTHVHVYSHGKRAKRRVRFPCHHKIIGYYYCTCTCILMCTVCMVIWNVYENVYTYILHMYMYIHVIVFLIRWNVSCIPPAAVSSCTNNMTSFTEKSS